jgi:hypothetical protein
MQTKVTLALPIGEPANDIPPPKCDICGTDCPNEWAWVQATSHAQARFCIPCWQIEVLPHMLGEKHRG